MSNHEFVSELSCKSIGTSKTNNKMTDLGCPRDFNHLRTQYIHPCRVRTGQRNLEGHLILRFHFPGLESHGI